jgi:hypothetical protein
MILVLALLPTIQTIKSIKNNSGIEYLLDQKQLQGDNYNNIHRSIWIAQSFKPSVSPLAKILLKLHKPVLIDEPLQISIRKDLNGSELIYIPIQSDDIPYFEYWVEIDFPDIEVEINETYYILLRTDSPSGKSYRWYYTNNETEDPYSRGKLMISYDYGEEWELIELEDEFADSAFQTYSYKSKSDLQCNGFLNWTNITPGSLIEGSFNVINVGTPFSNLNWEISNWPVWGDWSFSPINGNDLYPEDGFQIVHISLKAPNSTIPEDYSGKILIVNTDNESDYCSVDTILITPKKIEKKTNEFILFIQKLFPFFNIYKLNLI